MNNDFTYIYSSMIRANVISDGMSEKRLTMKEILAFPAQSHAIYKVDIWTIIG